MQASGVSVPAAAATGPRASGVTAAQSRDQFLTLLTAQLRHQDPLEPIKDTEFGSQLAQFSTLEGIEKLNANFADLLLLQQLTQGANLVGHSIVFEQGENKALRDGTVDAVSVVDGKLQLLVGGASVPLESVRGFRAQQAGNTSGLPRNP